GLLRSVRTGVWATRLLPGGCGILGKTWPTLHRTTDRDFIGPTRICGVTPNFSAPTSTTVVIRSTHYRSKKRLWLWMATLAASAVAFGCHEQGTSTVLRPLQVTPMALDFGPAYPGVVVTKTVEIRNPGRRAQALRFDALELPFAASGLPEVAEP